MMGHAIRFTILVVTDPEQNVDNTMFVNCLMLHSESDGFPMPDEYAVGVTAAWSADWFAGKWPEATRIA